MDTPKEQRSPATYRRVVLQLHGGPEVLHVVEAPVPVPRPGEIRVKVLAADVSASDINVRRGVYPGAPMPPLTPGYAIYGVVDRLGEDVVSPAVGRPVAALSFVGGYSEYLCLPAPDVVPMPAGLEPAAAVALVLGYVAAYQMLHRVAHVIGGQQILVHGAAGGVGTALLELAAAAGVAVIATASRAKHPLVLRLGATPIDYRTEDFVARVAELTGGRGVDAAFDPIGAANLRRSARTVRPGGTVVGFGYYATAKRGGSAALDVLRQYLQMARWSLPPGRKHAAFYDIRTYRDKHRDWFRADLTALADRLAAGELRPVIAARLPLEAAALAHQLVGDAQVEGKIVLLPNRG
jgi:NADPH:quinone reductase-like Zn-dependent oxidoreductase